MAQRTGSAYLPARPEPECECPGVAKAWAIVSLLLGIIGFLIQPVVVGPLALTAGRLPRPHCSQLGAGPVRVRPLPPRDYHRHAALP